MRILHAITSLDPSLGGPPMVAARLAAAQATLGHEAGVVYYDAPHARDATDRAMGQVPGFSNVRRHALPPPAGGERVFARGAARAVAEIVTRHQTDILHLHGVWDPLLKAAAAAARAGGRPYAVAPHGMLDPWSLSQSRRKKQIALLLGYRRMLDEAAFLHALNADERRLAEPLKLRCPVEVIPNGVFLEEFEQLPPRGRFRAAFPRLADRPFVLFLSRLHHKKGLDYLADAFALLAPRRPDVQLVVAGPDGGERAPFEERIARAGVEDRVHLVGPLYGPDKIAALVDAACFCLPSRQEGFSIAITEALACGLPVVISDACHFPEVTDAGAGEVTPLDPARIADALGRVLRDPRAGEQMGRAGRQLIESRYTWPKIAGQCVAAYRRAATSSAARRPA